MIHPGMLPQETVERLRKLAAVTYGGRDDLYAAADRLGDDDLKAICRTLAEEMAANTARLEQVIAMHGREPGFKEAVASVLGDAIMDVFRRDRGDCGVLSAAKQAQTEIRKRYDETIAATGDPETQAMLDEQKKSVEFAERVLRRVGQPVSDSPGGAPSGGP